jgi:hypothetical protein
MTTHPCPRPDQGGEPEPTAHVPASQHPSLFFHFPAICNVN